ncbi:MAG: hypothetical protein LBT83_07335 [Tannerella sp.]|jgi:hypothetical protein|nr:hypothetical protein [Tannerella sp.]
MKSKRFIVRSAAAIAGMAGLLFACTSTPSTPDDGQAPAVPSVSELQTPFGKSDQKNFQSPPKVYHPETWFHFIGGNVAQAGITADLEAIAGAGLSGIQLFHGQFGGEWPGVTPQITCLSPSWDEAVKFTAEECRRLGLRFTMQNCPGWAMSGGPWIEPSNAMRHLVWSRTDVKGGSVVNTDLPVPQPNQEDWRDYKDITVLAFPTPLDDTGEPLLPQSIKSNIDFPWKEYLTEGKDAGHRIEQEEGRSHWVEVGFPTATPVRTVEFSAVANFSYDWCYHPGLTITVQAIMPDGSTKELLSADVPPGNWQDDHYFSLALSEAPEARTYRFSFTHEQNLQITHFRLYSAARKNNWESEAAWTLRGFVRAGEHPEQSPETFVPLSQIKDITASMDAEGHLNWQAPEGKWTILRVGHVNTGQKNGPAPKEGTGWECTKLSETGPNAHFAGYIGRLANGPLAGGLLNGMLTDSWECRTQTWTPEMEEVFKQRTGYALRQWIPAVFGYVVDDHETTARFLLDWKNTIGDLFSDHFFGRMAQLAHDNGLAVSFETAAGDVFPADIMKYFNYADIPMCEFWQPIAPSYVGSIHFKPIKPTASAARLYGKPRVAAEAFTSFVLTWDEHLSMLKEVANMNSVEGVTHLVFHTYTHNPRTDFLPPSTSFGAGIGTPFLREQTWWKHMPAFTDYLSRCSYLLERGRPVSDVLWYLGDEISHKPDQQAPFPAGFKYDYCNPDVLLNRLSVRDGNIVTPEGTEYKILWLNDNKRMLPETLEKLLTLVREGATLVGDAPEGLATRIDEANAQQRFDAAVKELWGETPSQKGSRQAGKGRVMAGTTPDAALKELNIQPDVIAEDALWLHRRTKGADWYFVTAPLGGGFKGDVNFRNTGFAEIWDPVTGEITPAFNRLEGDRTVVSLDLPPSGACFVVFRHDRKGKEKQDVSTQVAATPVSAAWTLSFPGGWGAPANLQTAALKAWKDLDLSPEGKAFSGTATYTTAFHLDEVKKDERLALDLGRVEMIAVVSINGQKLRTLWTPPYRLDITDAVRAGENTLSIDVTGTWFNRLVYDAGLPEAERKTWTIDRPGKDKELRESGLLGPVNIINIKQ